MGYSDNNDKKVNVTDIAKDVMQNYLPNGSDFRGPDYCATCDYVLRKKYKIQNRYPMTDTWLRYLRSYGKLYGITLVSRSKSLYNKGGQQKTLF